MKHRGNWAELIGVLIAGVIIGYFANGILNPNVCGFSSSAVCLGGVAEAVISPGAEGKLLSAIENAEESIHLILFEFSYSDLKEALVLAEERGVEVKLILDPRVDQNLDTADFLKGKGIEVRWSSPKFNYSHAKAAIFDGKKVLVGSINWSRNAMFRNREIGVIIESAELAKQLEQVFEEDWADGLEVK